MKCHESVEDNSKNDLAGMASKADGTIVLTLLDIGTNFWYRLKSEVLALSRHPIHPKHRVQNEKKIRVHGHS